MFIVFDGIDGTGKSTQVKLLMDWLTNEKIEFFKLREPGGSANSENIRQVFLKSKMEPISQLLLVGAARHENMSVLEKHSDKLIIADRFIDSTYAYQGLYLEKALIDQIIDLTVTKYPDYTFLFLYQYKKKYYNHFDELAIKRLDDLTSKFKERVELAPEKYFIVPDQNTIQDLHLLIIDKVKELLGL